MNAILASVEEPRPYDAEVAALLEDMGETHARPMRASRDFDLTAWTAATYWAV